MSVPRPSGKRMSKKAKSSSAPRFASLSSWLAASLQLLHSMSSACGKTSPSSSASERSRGASSSSARMRHARCELALLPVMMDSLHRARHLVPPFSPWYAKLCENCSTNKPLTCANKRMAGKRAEGRRDLGFGAAAPSVILRLRACGAALRMTAERGVRLGSGKGRAAPLGMMVEGEGWSRGFTLLRTR